MAAIWVAKTYSCSSKMLVTFYWNAKYSSLFRSFMVFFIKLTSSFTFFFFSDFFPVSSSSIYSYSEISFSFRELSALFWLEAEVFKVFFTEVDRTGFSFLGSSFFGSYFLGGDYFFYFFELTPELLSALLTFLGGILLAGIVGWLGFWFWLEFLFSLLDGATLTLLYSFLMFLAEFIFWMCYFENSTFFYSLPNFLLFYSTILLYISLSSELSLSLSAYLSVFKLWSAEELPGETQAIMTILEFSPFAWNESLKMSVSFEALKGTWSALSSIALIHYFNANKLN